MLLPTKNTPRWIIFLIDVTISIVAYIMAYLVRFEFRPPQNEVDLALQFVAIFLGVRVVSFFIGKTYAGIIRYTSTQDTQRIFIVLTAGTLAFALFNQIRFHFFDGLFFVPYSIIILEYLLTLFAMVVSRIAVKVMYMELKNPESVRKRVVIYGAGESGLITKRTIDRDSRSGIHVVAFIDDDATKSGKKLEGSSIYQTQKIDELFSNGKVDEVIIAIPSIEKKKKAAFINKALGYNVRVSNIPPVKQWIGGQLSMRQIRDIRIEDLLGRESIRLDSASVRAQVKDKAVLVTGAAGSIGSELVRQLLAYQPKTVVLLDQAETPLFELENELHNAGHLASIEIVMGDVRQADRMRRMMDYFKPQIIYHAAAYKHVPLMESNPSEAVLANVQGTQIMADLAEEFGTEKFVLISTDKAVNPTSVMGCTKRIAEIYVQSKNKASETAFITTRFGNVLGSNGSVIPVFKRQIEAGGPVTVTHPEVTRFFMTIPEAVQLVLEAGAMGSGGEIFAFDMGESVKVIDLARNMIKLSGMEEGVDIEITYTGLRKGEKLYEEVLSDAENTLPTHHEKIVVAKVREYQFETIKQEVNALIALFDEQNNEKMVSKMKQIVPEYVSNNSEFEKLDA
ncbi:MAG: polysaccharide biosynthesis protein [Flavobacteriales bacterium]